HDFSQRRNAADVTSRDAGMCWGFAIERQLKEATASGEKAMRSVLAFPGGFAPPSYTATGDTSCCDGAASGAAPTMHVENWPVLTGKWIELNSR
ncbi:hypothetical protein, partial [Bradyrhizobium manausense]|uniref:hypothetical protein n=1 Tax=Bradyrhizobium manausense TaxID=989370 RepID=UPI001BACD8C7